MLWRLRPPILMLFSPSRVGTSSVFHFSFYISIFPSPLSVYQLFCNWSFGIWNNPVSRQDFVIGLHRKCYEIPVAVLSFFVPISRILLIHKMCGSDAFPLFSFCRFEKLYGGKAYVGLRIPDADTGSRQNIDLVVVTKEYVSFFWICVV